MLYNGFLSYKPKTPIITAQRPPKSATIFFAFCVQQPEIRIIEAQLNGREVFSDNEHDLYVSIIHRNIFSIFETILLYCEDKEINLIQRVNSMSVQDDGYTADQIDTFVEFLQKISTTSIMQFWVKPQDVKTIQLLYNSPPLKELLEKRNEYDLFDQAD